MSSHDSTYSHPYVGFEGTPAWSAIDKALQELAGNRDLIETTKHEYIVGFLCKSLAESVDEAPTPEVRRQALRSIRASVRQANPAHRDLVEELIQERQLEANHG